MAKCVLSVIELTLLFRKRVSFYAANFYFSYCFALFTWFKTASLHASFICYIIHFIVLFSACIIAFILICENNISHHVSILMIYSSIYKDHIRDFTRFSLGLIFQVTHEFITHEFCTHISWCNRSDFADHQF